MEKTYESFSEKYIKEYKREEELLGITELSLTQREKFKLRDISDINDKVMYLKNIQKIDISNNYISKLILKKFPILSIIIASKNMISEVNLVLPKLKILDLSYNLVKTIPDFTKTPEITELNFSRNLISRITINDFSKLKQSLTKLDLSYNRINFDLVNDFISLVDGLKFFDLTEFSIQGNLFNEKNKALINSYKSLISLSFKKLLKLNGESISFSEGLIVNQEEIIKQMLLEQDFQNRTKDFQNKENEINKYESTILKFKNSKILLKKPSSASLDSSTKSEKHILEIQFKHINEIINKLVMSNGENQNLYLELLKEVNEVIKIDDIEENSKEGINVKNLYNAFLMNCNELLCLNPNCEQQILKLLAQFSLVSQLGFGEITLEFLKAYVNNNEDKKIIVKEIIENIVITNLQLMSQIPYDMINRLINFFKETKISSSLLYQNLILNIIKQISTMNKEIEEKEKGKKTENYKNEIEEIRRKIGLENLDNYINVLNFIIEYLKSESELYKEKQIKINNDKLLNFDIDRIKKNNNDKSEISDDENIDKTDEATINNYLIGDILQKYDFKIGKEESDEKLLDILQLYEKYEFKLNNEFSKGDKENIFGRPIFKEMVNKNELVNIQICSEPKKQYFMDITFIYIFLNIFRETFHNLKECKLYFPSIMEKKNYKLYHQKFFKEIELLNTLISTFNVNQYKYNHLLTSCDVEKIIDILDSLIKEIIEEKSDGVPYDKIILKSIYQTKDARYNDLSKLFFQDLPLILDCIGTLISFLREREFKSKIDSNILDKYYNILKQDQADPLIIIGTCKLMNHILQCPLFLNNELIFAKVFDSSSCFEKLLNYIDQSKKQYANAIEKLDSEKKDKKFRKHRGGIEFENIESKEIFDFFISIIDIFLTICKFNSVNDYKILRQLEDLIIRLNSNQSNLFNLLGNCLKIRKSDEIRQKAIECLYHSESKHISYDIIQNILDILKNYNESVTEGQTEYVLSLCYLTLTNKLLYSISNKETNGYKTFKQALNLAISFLDSNSNRQVTDAKEEKEKNTLSLCLIVFLSSASRIPEIYSELFNEKSEKVSYLHFKKILNNDFFFFHENSYYPIELERTYLGSYLIVLFETMENNNPIPPYSYPFLRILMKISDIIGYCDDASYPNLSQNSNMEELFRNVFQICRDRFFIKVRNETKNWYHFSTCCANKIEEIKNPELLKYLEESHKFIYETESEKNEQVEKYVRNTKKNEVDKNLESLINDEYEEEKRKAYLNEAIFPKISIKELLNEQVNYLIYFQNLFYYLLGEKTTLRDDTINNELKRKYYVPILESEKIYEEYITYKNYGNIKTIIGDIKHYNSEIPFSSSISKITLRKLKNQNLESYMKSSNEIVFELENQRNEKVNNFTYKNDLNSYELYGIKEGSKRREMDENINNPHLRSLIISTFLRGVYSILISPSIKMREDFIKNLFYDDKFKYLLLYAGTQRMYINYDMFMIFEKLFHINNFETIIKACSFSPYSLNSKEDVIKKFNETIFNKNYESSDSKLNKELNLFHKFYMTSLFLEREINKNKRTGLNDLLFLLTFERAMYSFINSYWQYNFQYIDQEFRYKNIIKKISVKDTFHFFFKVINQLKRYSIFSFNLIKKYMNNYYIMQGRVLYNIGIGELEGVVNFMKERQRNYLLYLAKNEFEIIKIYELLALFREIDEKGEIEILYILLNIKNEKYNIEKCFTKILIDEDYILQAQAINKSLSNKLLRKNTFNQILLHFNIDDYNIDNNLLKDITEINFKLAKRITELINFKKKIIKKYLLNNNFILEVYYCFINDKIKYEDKKQEEFVLALTKDTIYFAKIIDKIEILKDSNGEQFEIIVKDLDFENEENDEKQTTKGETINGNTKDKEEEKNKEFGDEAICSFCISIESIHSIFIYDYSNKIYIRSKDGNYFSVMFNSNIYSISFINEIKVINRNILILKSDSLNELISNDENNDDRINQIINNKISNNIITDIYKIQKAQKIMIEELKKYSRVNVQLTNAIEENIYRSFYKNWFINENIILLKEPNRILYCSPYCLYLIKEEETFERKINIDYFGGNAKINENNLFKISDKIFYSDIKEVKNKFTDLEMTIISQYKKQKKKEITIKFMEKYEMFLTNINLTNINKFSFEKYLREKKKNNKGNVMYDDDYD